MIKGITIIICTYNGAQRLIKTIAHIARQIVPAYISWEVVLADNASTDCSSDIAQAEWQKYNLPQIPFHIISEPKPGKLYALQKAVQAARYEYLVTCDDDNWLASDYIFKVYQLFEATPQVAAIGGRGVPVTSNGILPEWFKDFEVVYAVGPQAARTGIIPPRATLWGAGLSTRRSVYLKTYAKYPSFLLEHDVDVIFAEDTEYCYRLILQGYYLFYDTDLVYHHFISDSKLDIHRRDAYIERFKEADYVLRKYYAAIRTMVKTKNRPATWLMLTLVTPLLYIFSFSKKRAEMSRNTLFHLLPFEINTDPISKQIKAFMKS